MVMEDNTRFLTDRIWKKILPPELFCNIFILVETSFSFFFLVSRFCPKEELVIFSAFMPFWILFSTIECFFATAGSQLFSICKGAGNHPAAQRTFAETMTAQMLFVAAGSLFFYWMTPCIVRFLGLPPESVPLAVYYGRLMFVCGLLDAFSTSIRLFVQSDSRPRTGAIIAMSIATLMLMCMILCFCILHKGLITYYWFYLGSLIFNISLYLILFICKKTTIKLQFRWMRWQTFRELAALSSNKIVEYAGVFVISLLITRWLITVFGPASVTIMALLSILSKCGYFFRKAYISSMQSLVGVYRGESNSNGIRYVCKKGFIESLYIQLGSVLFLLFFAEQICRWMNVLENYPGEAAFAVRLFALSIPFCHVFSYFASYYVICGYDKFIVIFSLTGNLLVYFLTTAYFLLVLRDEHLCWWFYPLAWILTVLFMIISVYWKKYKGNFQDFLLLPKKKPIGKQYYFLLKNQAEDFQDYRVMLNAFLHKQTVDPKTERRVLHLFEEMFLFAGEQIDGRKDALFFIVITISDQNVELALRYDSRESCLNSVLNGVQTVLDPERVAGAKILSRLSDSIYIDRVYGINFIRLTLNREIDEKSSGTSAVCLA